MAKQEYHEWGVFVSAPYFWVNLTGYSSEFHVAFTNFQDFEYLISDILKENLLVVSF